MHLSPLDRPQRIVDLLNDVQVILHVFQGAVVGQAVEQRPDFSLRLRHGIEE
jgi:hypothetical protein